MCHIIVVCFVGDISPISAPCLYVIQGPAHMHVDIVHVQTKLEANV